MILTLTLNPAIDLTYPLTHLEPGTTHRVTNPLIRAGGKGVNVARVLTEQGHDALVLAPVGGPTGEQFRTDLDNAGMNHRLVQVHAPTRRTITLVTPEHTTPLNEAGKSPAPAELDQVLQATAEALTGAQVLVCSGSIPEGSPEDLIPRVVRLARDAGVPVIVDTSGPALLAAADAGADVLKPNRDELAEILPALRYGTTMSDPEPPRGWFAWGDGSELPAGPVSAPGSDSPGVPGGGGALEGIEAVTKSARLLAVRGGSLVFASLGAEGMLAVPPAGPAWHAHLPQPLHGNPTGAGDAAVAAIAVAARRHGRTITSDDLAETLATATAWSAAAVHAPSAGSIVNQGRLAAKIVTDRLPPATQDGPGTTEEHP